jgi:hypothetical protein
LLISVGKLVVIVGSILGQFYTGLSTGYELLNRIVGNVFTYDFTIFSIAATCISTEFLSNFAQCKSRVHAQLGQNRHSRVSSTRLIRWCKNISLSGVHIMNVLQTNLGANNKKHQHKRQAHTRVAGRFNRSKLNALKKILRRDKCTNLSTERQNTAKTKQLSSYYTGKLSTIINYLIPCRRTNLMHALSTEHSGQPVTNNGHISSRSKPVIFDTDMVEIKVDTGFSYSMSRTQSDLLKEQLHQ